MLRKYLLTPDCAFKTASYRIGHEVFEFRRSGRVRLQGRVTNTIDPNLVTLRSAVSTVVEVAAKIIENNESVIAASERSGLSTRPEVMDFRARTDELRAFFREAERLLPSLGHGAKKRDSEDRAWWHLAANYFAGAIRRDLASAGEERSTRKIAGAVRAALAMLGVEPEEETVRKAIVGKTPHS